jgi:hypothetical protein
MRLRKVELTILQNLKALDSRSIHFIGLLLPFPETRNEINDSFIALLISILRKPNPDDSYFLNQYE